MTYKSFTKLWTGYLNTSFAHDAFRIIDQVKVKGKSQMVSVFEIFNPKTRQRLLYLERGRAAPEGFALCDS